MFWSFRDLSYSISKNVMTTAVAGAFLVCGAADGFAQEIESDPSMDNTYQYESFEDIDVDKSGYLESGEYIGHAFGRADWDDDGYLEDTEWVRYTEVYYDPYDLDYDTFVQYDTDGDGYIDRSEFNEVPVGPLYEAWDYDDDALINEGDWDKVTTFYYDKE